MINKMLTREILRRYALTHSLFPPTTLSRAIEKLGFVQADPIRAPARAQDLTLRHRVKNYRAGDLERRYARLAVDEDFFINYGFVPRALRALMHPRSPRTHWHASIKKRALTVLEFVRERGIVHPNEVHDHFAHGRVVNAWGGSSNATTHLLDAMHYRGLLRVARRENGIRLYAADAAANEAIDAATRQGRLDTLVDTIVRKYAPLPTPSLHALVSRLRYATPQWTAHLRSALERAKERLAHARVDGIEWYWPADEAPAAARSSIDAVRLLAPFDPLVWDRRRFELFWGWAYRFEAYTPPSKRKLGYYALPLLWRDTVIGWGNVGVREGKLVCDFGYLSGHAPSERGFAQALEKEVEDMRTFLRL